MVASLLKMTDLNWAVPDDTTVCRRQKTLADQIPYRRIDGPLNLLVDGTGMKFQGDGEWQARSRIEAAMRCLKALGVGIAAKVPDRQSAEIQIRVALMNRFNALGTAKIVRVA